jgi:hypothetical protein
MSDTLTILGEKRFLEIMASAPRSFTKATRMWMYRERRRFVGNKARDGKVRTAVHRKRRHNRDGQWPMRVARAFKGFMKNRSTLQGMSMHMGVGFDRSKKFTSALAQMQHGFTTVAKGLMIVPVWKNLAEVGIQHRQHTRFLEMMKRGELDVVYKGGRAFYFAKGESGKLLWVGVRQVSIKKQYDVTGMWNRDNSAVLMRGERMVARTLRAIERGYRIDE